MSALDHVPFQRLQVKLAPETGEGELAEESFESHIEEFEEDLHCPVCGGEVSAGQAECGLCGVGLSFGEEEDGLDLDDDDELVFADEPELDDDEDELVFE